MKHDLHIRTFVLYYTCKIILRTLTKEFLHSNSHPALSKNSVNSVKSVKTPIECRPEIWRPALSKNSGNSGNSGKTPIKWGPDIVF